MPKRPKSAKQISSFNGDEIRDKSKQGMSEARAAQGLSTVEGSRPPSVDPNVKPPREIKFVSSAGVSFPVAKLGKATDGEIN